MERYADEELLYLTHCHEEEAERCLVKRYQQLIEKWILNYQNFFEKGIDYDECLQVGMIHFTHVMQAYRDDRNASLRTFAKFAVLRRTRTYVLTQTHKMYRYGKRFSLDEDVAEDSAFKYHDVIEDDQVRYRPDEIFLVKERNCYYQSKMKEVLTPFEKSVADLKIQNYSNQEIAEKLNVPIKSVYNASYRMHKSVESIDDYDEM